MLGRDVSPARHDAPPGFSRAVFVLMESLAC